MTDLMPGSQKRLYILVQLQRTSAAVTMLSLEEVL